MHTTLGGVGLLKVNHRIAGPGDDPFWLEIDYLGLGYERAGNCGRVDWHILNITEDQPQWPDVERLCAYYERDSGLTTNLYTKRELDAAERLDISATGHQGYPKPEDGYFKQTYDSTSCERCGIHGAQVAPLRFSGEPKSKTIHFLQLHWVYDEFFVRHAARDVLRREGVTGVEFGPVLVNRKGEASQEASQMRVLHTLPPALDASGLQTVTCKRFNEEWRPHAPAASADSEDLPYCGRVKWGLRGPLRFDRAALLDAPDVVKSHEWFGSGGSASQCVIVSQRFRQIVVAARWRGLRFEPIELVG